MYVNEKKKKLWVDMTRSIHLGLKWHRYKRIVKVFYKYMIFNKLDFFYRSSRKKRGRTTIFNPLETNSGKNQITNILLNLNYYFFVIFYNGQHPRVFTLFTVGISIFHVFDRVSTITANRVM